MDGEQYKQQREKKYKTAFVFHDRSFSANLLGIPAVIYPLCVSVDDR